MRTTPRLQSLMVHDHTERFDCLLTLFLGQSDQADHVFILRWYELWFRF